MATIDVRREHNIGKDRARGAAQQIAEKLEKKIDVRYRWEGDELRFERTGAKGCITVADSEVRVEIDLGFALRPLRGKVERRVGEYLDEALR